VKRLVTHKLRTPLNGLVGPLELLNAGGDSDEDERKMLLSISAASAKRMEEAVSSLENFFFSPRIPVSRHKCTLADAIGLAELSAKEQSLPDPIISCKAPGNTVIPLGPNQLYNIFAELFENAVKFHPQHEPHVSVDIARDNEIVNIIVEDDGSHASPSALKHLHVPFYQSEELLTGEMDGHGLGLAQVARIMYSAGGRVAFYNRVDGPGLRVHLRLLATSLDGAKKVPIARIFADNTNAR
jgi:signal transduction histidine kinase